MEDSRVKQPLVPGADPSGAPIRRARGVAGEGAEGRCPAGPAEALRSMEAGALFSGSPVR